MVNRKMRALYLAMAVTLTVSLAAGPGVMSALASDTSDTEAAVMEDVVSDQAIQEIEEATEVKTETPVLISEPATESSVEETDSVEPVQAETATTEQVQQDPVIEEPIEELPTESTEENWSDPAEETAQPTDSQEDLQETENVTEKTDEESTEATTENPAASETEKESESETEKETEEKKSDSHVPDILLPESAVAGEEYEVVLKNAKGSGNTGTVTLELPEGTKLKSIGTMEFSNGTTTVTYKDSNDQTASSADSARKVVFSVESNDGKEIGDQTNAVTATVMTETAGSVTFSATSVFEKEMRSQESMTVDEKTEAGIKMTLVTESPDTESEYIEKIEASIPVMQDEVSMQYEVDNAVITSIFFPDELVGGDIEIVETDKKSKHITIDNKIMDLSVYKSSKVTVTTKIAVSGKMELLVSLKAADQKTTSVTAAVKASIDNGQSKEEYKDTLETALNYRLVTVPVLMHSNDVIAFEQELKLELGGIGYSTNTRPDKYIYSVKLPSFLTLTSVVVPEIKNVDVVEVYLTDKNGKRDLCASAKPGDIIKGTFSDVELLEYVINTSSETMEAETSGALVFVNNIKKNKSNYFAFQAAASLYYGDLTVGKISGVTGVTFDNYVYTEPEQPETQPETEKPGGGSGGSSGGTETEPPETEAPETEDPDAIRESEQAEAEKKKKEEQAAKIENDEKEQDAKNRAALAQRLKAAQNRIAAENSKTGTEAASGTASSSVTEKTKAEKEKALKLEKKYGAKAERISTEKQKALAEKQKLLAISEGIVSDRTSSDERLATDEQKELAKNVGMIAIDEIIVENIEKQ